MKLKRRPRQRGSHSPTSIFSVDYSNSEAIASAVDSLWMQRTSTKYTLERQWYQNIAWYMGLQNLIWSDHQRGFVDPKLESHNVRLVINYIQSTVRKLESRIIKPEPEWDVIPATGDTEDIIIAELANKVLRYNWYRSNMDELSGEVLLWTLVCGNGLLKQTWNPDLGDMIDEIEDQLIHLGDLESKVISPFAFNVDNRVNKLEDASWGMESSLINRHALMEMYPRAEQASVHEGGAISSTFHFEDHIRNLVGTATTRGTLNVTSDTIDSDNVLVHELWIPARRNSKGALKKGKYIVVAGGVVVNGNGKGVDFPYKHNQIPYVHFREIPIPGRFWATSTVEQLMPVQSELNRTRSQAVEIRNSMSNPIWLIPRGSVNNKPTNKPGQVLNYNYPLKPERVDGATLPSSFDRLNHMTLKDIDDISGVHDVSRAEAPGQVRSGRGILALIEQDESLQGITIRNFQKSIEKTGKQNLSITAQYVTEDRIGRIIGQQDEVMLFAYSGNNLVGRNSHLPGANYFDVRLKTIIGLPHSRQAQQAMVDGLLERNVLNPQTDKQMILRLLGLGNVEDVINKSRVHRSKQLEEIQYMQQWEEMPVNTWDNHAAHIDTVNEFRTTKEFERLPDNIKELFELHVQRHKEQMAYEAIEPQILTQKAMLVASMRQGLPNEGQQQGPPGSGRPQAERDASQP